MNNIFQELKKCVVTEDLERMRSVYSQNQNKDFSEVNNTLFFQLCLQESISMIDFLLNSSLVKSPPNVYLKEENSSYPNKIICMCVINGSFETIHYLIKEYNMRLDESLYSWLEKNYNEACEMYNKTLLKNDLDNKLIEKQKKIKGKI